MKNGGKVGKLKEWKLSRVTPRGNYKVFEVHERVYENPYTGEEVPTFIIRSQHWVNVIATTPGDEIILIKQFRFGSGRVELEIPGGLVEPGEDPARAAARELLEETGYAGGEPELIGKVNPNPALHDHACYTFWIKDCTFMEQPRFDGPNEKVETVVASVEKTFRHVKDGTIVHSLVIDAIFFYLVARGICDIK